MNDFTKDELNDLLYSVNISCKQGVIVPSNQECNYLYEKINSMIDNYCDHENMEYIGDVYGYNCTNCNKEFTAQSIDEGRHDKIINGE